MEDTYILTSTSLEICDKSERAGTTSDPCSTGAINPAVDQPWKHNNSKAMYGN